MSRIIFVMSALLFHAQVASAVQANQSNPQTTPATSTPATQPEEIDSTLLAELREIDRRASAIIDLKADFEQLKHTALLKKPMRSSGVLRIKGSAMRWETRQPHASIMVVDESELKVYYPRQATMEIYPIQTRLAQLAASPLPRLDVVQQYFSIERTVWPDPSNAVEAENRLALWLIPLNDDLRQHVEEVFVLIDRGTACAVAVQITNPDHERIELAFTNIRLNTGVNENDFGLTPPAGTKITRPLESAPPPPARPTSSLPPRPASAPESKDPSAATQPGDQDGEP